MATVLVVDDQASNRELVVTLLNYSGHVPMEAADGHLALAQVRAAHPDLVICDILMPTMDGYEFVRQLRADPAIAHTQVIFYTATFMEREARSLASSCGVSQVLVKPSEPQEILRTIEQALGRSKLAEPVADEAQFDRQHLRLLTDKLALKVGELESANQRLSALTNLNLQLASEHDPLVLLDKVCRGARDLLGASHTVLAVRDKNGAELTHVSSWGLAPAQAEQLLTLTIDAGVLGQVMVDGRARRLLNPGGDPVGAGLPAEFPPLRCGLLAPIVSLHRAYGWILLIDKLGADAFSDDDEMILSIYAAQAGRIYENGSLYKKIKRTAEQLEIEVEERRRVAQDLITANETLEQRVLQRTAELRDVIEGLESFNRSVSHDLRGPLGGIAGAARLAQEFVAGNQGEKATRFLQIIAAQAEATGQLVDALLSLARASDASFARERVDMSELTAEVIASLPQARPDAPLPIVVGPLAEIQADRKLVRQVLVNLISNALKFTSEVPRPEVHVGMLDARETPVFFVRDNGVGFDAEMAHQLFRPFHRLHGTRFEGSGVGLSIVKKIVDRHEGKVWAESASDQGATFYFSFGAAAASSTSA
jgi:signal transduction histidine kinase/CheY-like chemotaxis protein